MTPRRPCAMSSFGASGTQHAQTNPRLDTSRDNRLSKEFAVIGFARTKYQRTIPRHAVDGDQGLRHHHRRPRPLAIGSPAYLTTSTANSAIPLRSNASRTQLEEVQKPTTPKAIVISSSCYPRPRRAQARVIALPGPARAVMSGPVGPTALADDSSNVRADRAE